jgi:hypothetical protein
VTLISSFMNYTDFCGMYGDSFLLAKGKMLWFPLSCCSCGGRAASWNNFCCCWQVRLGSASSVSSDIMETSVSVPKLEGWPLSEEFLSLWTQHLHSEICFHVPRTTSKWVLHSQQTWSWCDLQRTVKGVALQWEAAWYNEWRQRLQGKDDQLVLLLILSKIRMSIWDGSDDCGLITLMHTIWWEANSWQPFHVNYSCQPFVFLCDLCSKNKRLRKGEMYEHTHWWTQFDEKPMLTALLCQNCSCFSCVTCQKSKLKLGRGQQDSMKFQF